MRTESVQTAHTFFLAFSCVIGSYFVVHRHTYVWSCLSHSSFLHLLYILTLFMMFMIVYDVCCCYLASPAVPSLPRYLQIHSISLQLASLHLFCNSQSISAALSHSISQLPIMITMTMITVSIWWSLTTKCMLSSLLLMRMIKLQNSVIMILRFLLIQSVLKPHLLCNSKF